MNINIGDIIIIILIYIEVALKERTNPMLIFNKVIKQFNIFMRKL